MDYVGNTYFKVKGEIIQCEKYLLKALGICVHVQHPHKLIITFLQVLELEKEVDLVQSVWNYMNDSLRTNVFVRFSPDKIACACIYLAARKFQIPLPTNPGWWLMFEASKRDIEIISLEILQLYTYPNRSLEEVEKEVTKIKEELAKKRQIEIKEIQLSTTQSSKNGSPNKDSPSVVVSDEKKSSQSGSELKSPIHLNNKLLERNGDKLDLSPTKKTKKRLRSSSLGPSSRHKRRRHSRSPGGGSAASHSSSAEMSGHNDIQFRPISSPIKLSGESANSASPLEEEDDDDDDRRIPRKYQNKYDNHKHKKHRKSRHERHHKREKHRQRERSRSRTRYESESSRISRSISRNDPVKRRHHHSSSHHRK